MKVGRKPPSPLPPKGAFCSGVAPALRYQGVLSASWGAEGTPAPDGTAVEGVGAAGVPPRSPAPEQSGEGTQADSALIR